MFINYTTKERNLKSAKVEVLGDLKMGYEHTNSKGKKYYLHSRGRLFFFSKLPEDGIELPAGYKVVENQTTGLPMIKKE